MYKILAKSALDLSQIEVKQRIGCDGIEIQLLDELYGPHGNHDWLYASDVFDLHKFLDQNILAVHAPISKAYGDVLIERLADDEDIMLFDQLFYIANFIGRHIGRPIRVIMHSETSVSILQDINNGWVRLVRYVDEMLTKYPFTELCIENVTPLRGIKDNRIIQLANNYYEDNVLMAKLLRAALHTDRVGVVLDTCHQGITEMYMNLIYTLSPDIEKPDFSIEHYIQSYAPYLKIIHLADFKGNGYGKNHGTPFESQEKFNHIMDLVCKYVHPSCYITLEINESNFMICEGYAQTKARLDYYFKQKAI